MFIEMIRLCNFIKKTIHFDTFKMTRRLYSSCKQVPKVCVVGAGPAGFYAATHLNKKLDSVQIDIIEKLPIPFGLVRYGVAPDHPEVKNVINQFTKLARQQNVNFYGNITLGQDISLYQLRQHYDAVLLTYGAEEDKTLGIENEGAQNVIAARNFVGWYNGHPRDRNLKIDLSGHTAAILGQGNVALDVARILLSPINSLKKTDITEYALQTLAQSNVKKLYLVGRRGPLNVAFTIKELREQVNLNTCATIWRKTDFVGVDDAVSKLARPRKRLTELMLKSLNDSKDLSSEKFQKCFKPIFFRSPQKFLIDNENRLTAIELTCNKLVGDSTEEQKYVPTKDIEMLNCSLAFRSIGYKSIQVDTTLNFLNGLVLNDRGRVIESETDNCLGKLYVAGWLATGPVGVILHTMSNAFQVAKLICDDLQNRNQDYSKGGFEAIRKNILKNNCLVDWQGWEKIDKFETEQGKNVGKPREKITSVEEMIKIANM